MTGFTERMAAADGFRLRYFEAGTGDPLVTIHGAGGVRLTPALDLLAAERRVIAVELPGFGGVPNDVSQSLDDLAGTVAALAAALGLERYHLLGTSLGGAVALHVALRFPGRVTSLVLEAPAQFRVGGRDPASLPAAEAVRAFRAHPDRAPAWEPADPARQAVSRPLVARVLTGTPEYDESVAERMTACPVRTLVLFGTRDGVIPPENGRIYRRLMPNCTLQYVYDAAHAIAQDRAAAFADVTGDFLRRGLRFLIREQDTLINP
jgi:pimeloyl-ACP methyl ester carboxylesterase